jgi:hypothetical protein
MKQTGHRSVSVVRRYIRDAELFDAERRRGHWPLTGLVSSRLPPPSVP